MRWLRRPGRAVGPPRHRARRAPVMTVMGLALAKACSQPGMVATGTRAELVKNKMTTGNRPASPADSGSRTSEAEQQVEPGERKPRRDREADGGQGGGGPGVEPEPDRGADGDHQPDDEQVAQGVGGDPPGQHRAAGDGQGPEPVDHAGGQVFGDGHPGLGGAEPDRQHEDPRQQVVDVAGHPGHVDGPAEGVAEQQHEQHRLHAWRTPAGWVPAPAGAGSAR